MTCVEHGVGQRLMNSRPTREKWPKVLLVQTDSKQLKEVQPTQRIERMLQTFHWKLLGSFSLFFHINLYLVQFPRKVSIDWSFFLWVDGRGWTSIGQGGSEEDIFENTDQLFPFSYTRCSIRLIGFRAIDLFLTINCSGIWRRKKHFFLVEKFRKMLIMEICDITWAVLYTVYTICELNDWMVLVSPLL